jgi:hypothetical protein
MEHHNNAPILYGQGNFLFDWQSPRGDFYEGVLAILEISSARELSLSLVPCVQTQGLPGVRRMTAQQETAFRLAFENRNRVLGDDEAFVREWQAFCSNKRDYYLNAMHGRVTLLRRAARRLGLLGRLTSAEVHRNRLHHLRCESHWEALVAVLHRAGGANLGVTANEELRALRLAHADEPQRD